MPQHGNSSYHSIPLLTLLGARRPRCLLRRVVLMRDMCVRDTSTSSLGYWVAQLDAATQLALRISVPVTTSIQAAIEQGGAPTSAPRRSNMLAMAAPRMHPEPDKPPSSLFGEGTSAAEGRVVERGASMSASLEGGPSVQQSAVPATGTRRRSHSKGNHATVIELDDTEIAGYSTKVVSASGAPTTRHPPLPSGPGVGAFGNSLRKHSSGGPAVIELEEPMGPLGPI